MLYIFHTLERHSWPTSHAFFIKNLVLNWTGTPTANMADIDLVTVAQPDPEPLSPGSPDASAQDEADIAGVAMS